MSTLHIGITTSPRKRRYLLDTVDSLLNAAMDTEPHVVISPNFVDHEEQWGALHRAGCEVLPPLVDATLAGYVVEDPQLAQYKADPTASEWVHRGLQRNTDRLMGELIGRNVEWFVVCQDDILCCRRAVDRIAQTAHALRGRQGIGAVSFYTPWAQAGRWRTALWPYTPGFYGELCLLWNREAATEFLKMSDPAQAHDLEIQRFFRSNRRWRLYGHSPCLVQHVGLEASARGAPPGGQRVTMNFDPNHNAVLDGKRW